MRDVISLIHELESAGQNPGKSIMQSMKETGKRAVGCFPIYSPEEIVYAAGMLPVGMWGGPTAGTRSDRYLQSFCCSIMKANTEQAILGQYDFLSGVIVTAYCDTLKCIIENWKTAFPNLNIIPVVYPQNRKIPAGKDYMRDELERIKRELEKISGREVTPENLEASMEVYDDYRTAMQEFVELVPKYPALFNAKSRHLIIKAAYFMDKKIYTDRMRQLIHEVRKLPEEITAKKKVILTGLLSEPDGVLDIITENQMFVVADDLAQETRQFRTIAPKMGDALQRMVERIALQDGCAFFYDKGKTRGTMLKNMVKKYQADGVIVCQLKFCDPEEIDYPIIKKELEAEGIPLLYMEIEQQMDSLEQLRTRIQSFGEMIS
jgi:Benzoyl-CoA reductase/2-hydroxyglutaryl-CoA dehydratase subunit, BcrC/BadD/HgdB